MPFNSRGKKLSAFTKGSALTDDTFYSSVQAGINKTFTQAQLIADFADVYGASLRTYEFQSQLVADDIALGEYAIVEENDYSLYKITNDAATAPNIALSSGVTAKFIKVLADSSPVEYNSMADFIASSPETDTVYIKSYNAWVIGSSTPKGAHYRYKTGGTNTSPTVGSPVAVSTIGTGTQAGYAWTADGAEWKVVEERIIDPAIFAIGNGDADDSQKWSDLHTWMTAGATIRFVGSTTITSPVEFTKALVFDAEGGALIPNIATTGGKAFIFNGDNQHVYGLTIQGSGLSGTLSGNCYGIFGGDGTTKRKNHTYKDIKIYNLTRDDGNTGTSNLIVTHCLYIDNVDNVTVKNCEFVTSSGAALFLRDVDNIEIKSNKFSDNTWYPVNLESGVTNFEISYNDISHPDSVGVFWGGMINLVSQVGESLCTDGSIHHNNFSGYVSYGGVIRIQSGHNVDIYKNKIVNISLGSVLPTATQTITGIRVVTRGVSTASQSGPSSNISIFDNELHAPANDANLTNRQAIYIDNQFQTTRTPMDNIRVENNRAYSESATVYWENGFIAHGQDGGITNLWVEDNYFEVYCQSGSIVAGGIGFVATDTDGLVDKVNIGGNHIIEEGTSDDGNHVGISIGAYVDNVVNTKANHIDNFYYGVRTLTNAGPTLKFLNDQVFENTVNRTVLEGPVMSHYAPMLLRATTAELTDISSDINDQLTYYKYAGLTVFNTTTSRFCYSIGSNANSQWRDGDTPTQHNPV